MSTFAERRDLGEALAPLDRLCGQGFDEDPTEIAAKHLGSPSRAVVALLEHNRAMPIEHARRLTALMNDGAKRIGEAGRGKCGLAIALMDVELAALRASPGRRLGFVDRRGNAVDVQDAGEDETAEARANDRESLL
jgi:hypothetical protein